MADTQDLRDGDLAKVSPSQDGLLQEGICLGKESCAEKHADDAILYRFDTYCEVVFSNGEKFTGKKTIIEGYCRKNGIKIIETIDKRVKKQLFTLTHSTIKTGNLPKGVKAVNIIRQIVGRCHVGQSNRKVIRYVISRLENKEATFWKLSKSDRRYLMEQTIKEHQENRRLYRDVMNGNL